MEKHFPAPNRDRINKLLSVPCNLNVNLQKKVMEDFVVPGSSKRKALESNENVPKKEHYAIDAELLSNMITKSSNSDNSDNDEDFSDNDSELNSDYNPFNLSTSDSDEDPWIGKVTTKVKKRKISSEATICSNQGTIQKLLINKRRSVLPTIEYSGVRVSNCNPPRDAIEKACEMKEELLQKLEILGKSLPPNTLDQLIDELGGPENVAEMTGRKGRIIQNEDGTIHYESRSEQDIPLETLNLTEKERFMNGEKDVAVISEAASSGISLHSDKRVINQRRRVHITLELPWSADRAIQQFGRTHRSNQMNAPEYIFLISNLAGERRFASTVAKRLESLGALTHGDRRATETRDLSQFNIDNMYGEHALKAIMNAIMSYDNPLVKPPQDYVGNFFKDVAASLVGVGLIVNSEHMPGILCLDKDYYSIPKFLNRILGMKVELQNRTFKYLMDTMEAVVEHAKKLGRYDLGILGKYKMRYTFFLI